VSGLVESLGTTDALSRLFSDAVVLGAMLQVEAALARAQARMGVISEHTADVIAAAARPEEFDAAAIGAAARASATPVIAVVDRLRQRVEAIDASCAPYVHKGATSQDVVDTALALVLQSARAVLRLDHERLERALRDLSDRHASTIMTGRTLLQPALPITFGLKAAGWYAAVRRSWRRVSIACDEGIVLQFGGPAGTLSAVGADGLKVSDALAAELSLRLPDAPWHSHRDRFAAIAAALGIYTGTLGKIARDVSLLMQHEVAEAAEPGGGSSSMPHKQNPAGCAIALAAAVRTPGLVAAFLTAMVQEHERAVGGWQSEWPTMAAIVEAAGAATQAMAEAIAGLRVDEARMAANLRAAGIGGDADLGAAEQLRQRLLEGA
jgi:3-carboxy-cis,cis-muconate cycloisomerase